MTNGGSPASTAPAPTARRRLLAGIMAFALAVHLWGIRRDLPYLPETDEPFLVNPTIWMASEWSGNRSGSTTRPRRSSIRSPS